ncbi:MAG: hypothetical protein J1F35_03355 [Erysipelotrichales bacterium]|nr:hypothetical protein [Erysipelotrichales bacterium]
MWKKILNKRTIYIGLFALLYLICAGVSLYHAIAFFGLANNPFTATMLAGAFEVGQAAVLFSLLTSKKDRSKILPWVLMFIFTLVQILGNVFSSYEYLIKYSGDMLIYFKQPIFIWTDIPDDQCNVILSYLLGGLLPITCLALTSMITNFLEDETTEKLENLGATEEEIQEIKDKTEELNLITDNTKELEKEVPLSSSIEDNKKVDKQQEIPEIPGFVNL